MADAAQQAQDELLRLARLTEKHTAQSAGANLFVAWVVGLFAVGGLILAILAVVALHTLNSLVSNGGTPTPSSTCQSQGGYDPTC